MNIRKVLTTGILAVMLVGALVVAFPGGSVGAQTPTPQPKKDPQAQGARIDARLQKAFRALQKLVDQQENNIKKSQAFTGKVEDLISKAKANGKDTAALEAAVAAFKKQETAAKELNNAAAVIVKTHAGFDANGKVVDDDQAKKTLQDGNQKVKEARGVFGEAFKNLREAFKAWREANPPTPKK